MRASQVAGGDKINPAALEPIGRLVGGGCLRVTDMFELERLKSYSEYVW